MMNRRTFLETATTLTAATLLTSRMGWAAADHKIGKIGVQLYTVRDQMKADFDGTLAKVAAIGYQEVEFADISIARQKKCEPPSTAMVWSHPPATSTGKCSATSGRGRSSPPKSSARATSSVPGFLRKSATSLTAGSAPPKPSTVPAK